MTVMVTLTLALAVVLVAATGVVVAWFVGRIRDALTATRDRLAGVRSVITELGDEAAVTRVEVERLQRSITALQRSPVEH